MHRWALTVMLLAGCHAQPPRYVWPEDCQPTAPSGARPLAEDSVAQLAGHWDLVVVTLSHGTKERPWRASLELEESDPTTRRRRAPLEVINGVLIGSARWRHGTGVDSAAVDVQGTTLSLGCVRNCTDGPRLDFRLLAIAGNQLWGLWEDPQDGLAIAVDSVGRPLPNPAGFFCAKLSSQGHR